MDSATSHLELLLELEARHDELLQRLAELDKRVEKVLAESVPAREGQAGGGPPPLPQ